MHLVDLKHLSLPTEKQTKRKLGHSYNNRKRRIFPADNRNLSGGGRINGYTIKKRSNNDSMYSNAGAKICTSINFSSIPRGRGTKPKTQLAERLRLLQSLANMEKRFGKPFK